jgi:HK97 family phage major capsid protein
MSMTIPEAHAEIRRLYDAAGAIDKKYPAGLTRDENAEDYAEVKRLLSEIDGLEEKLSGLEDADAQRRRIAENQKRLRQPVVGHTQPTGDDAPSKARRLFGAQFIESEEYKRAIESGVLNNPSTRIELGVKLDGSMLNELMRKALVHSGSGVGGPTIAAERVTGPEYLWRQTTLLDLIPTSSTTSNLIEYYEMTTSTNNAAAVAEATNTTGVTGLKPEGAIGWTLRQTPVSTIAEWVPVTNQMLADSPAAQSMIENQLLTHLALKLETDIISGNGTAPNLLGILSNPGILTTGLGAGSGSAADAVYHAMTCVMVTGLSNPSASVWNPVDFEAVRLSRETGASGGAYLMGPPSASGPITLWGRPVVISIGVPENTVIVADFTQMTLYDREQSAVRVVTINDQPIRNMSTLLAELRAAFALFRPTAVCRVTGA